MILKQAFYFSTFIAVILLFSGCAITTRSLEGTSETIVNTAEASVDLTSSTFPRSSGSDSATQAKAAKREMAVTFVSYNYEKVRRDASRGEGEFVETLGDLLLTSPKAIQEFPSFVKENYSQLFANEIEADRKQQGSQLVSRIEVALQQDKLYR